MNYVQKGYVRSGYVLNDSDTVGSYTFDKYGKYIFVSPSVANINLADMWSRFVDWIAIEENAKIKPAMRYSGYEVIPTGFTGAVFFVYNGWRVIYDPAFTAISGVLYSEDFDTGYWDIDYQPIFPVTVSAVVNTVVTGSGLDTTQTAQLKEVWQIAGLDKDNSMTVDNDNRTAGEINLSIVTNPDGSVTVLRL